MNQFFMNLRSVLKNIIQNILAFFKGFDIKYLKYILPATAVVIVAVVTATLLLSQKSMDKKALDPEVYNNVQVVISQTMEPLNQKTESTDSSVSGEDDYNVVDGSLVGDGSTGGEEQRSEPEKAVISTLQKQNDIIYEDGISGKYYFYSRDGKNYVLYYDTNYGIWDPGKWTEANAENFSIMAGFNFDTLKTILSKDFVKKDDYFVPKTERLSDIFMALLSAKNREKYSGLSLKMWIDKDKIQKISSEYIWDGNYKIVQEYDFTYGQVKLTVPKVDKVHGQNS